jgi:WD40 repeat protein
VTAAEVAPAGGAKPYDLFVSYAEADQDWVEGYLLDALDRVGIRYLHEESFRLGVPRILEFERAVASSGRTLLVLSPAWFASNVGQFVDALAQSFGHESGTWPVIPLLLEAVDLPPRLRQLHGLDATGGADGWEQAVQRLCAELNRPHPEPTPPPPCPYPGMAPFGEGQSEHFFGRDGEVEQLVQRLRIHPFVAVIGPSGSGKSSLVAAGLVPALRATRLLGGGTWVVRSLRPGEAPEQALADALGAADLADPAGAAARLVAAEGGEAARLLVVVDQLEELFTLGSPAPVAAAFEQALTRLTAGPSVWVVLTCRADFYPQLMTSGLWPIVDHHRFEVLPLGGKALREAIERPAEAVGVYVEAALVERLVADASGEPGLLPLVQETMVCLWEKLERRLLPLSAYEALVLPLRAYGDRERTGLQVAMARRADAAMAVLAPAEQAVARRIFVRLVQFGEGRADVRRQQPVPALRSTADDPATFERVLEHLVAHRLLTLAGGSAGGAGGDGGEGGGDGGDERRVDLSHEALISGWPTLQGWLAARREGELVRRLLVAKAGEWARLGRGEGGLLDEVELLEAERWLAGPDAGELGVDGDLTALVDASRAALARAEAEREAARRREVEHANALAAEQLERARIERERADEQARAATTLRWRARVLAAVVAVTVLAAGFAAVQWRRAEREARVNTSRELAAQARFLAEERLDLALLLSLEARRLSPTLEARGALLSALERDPRLLTYLHDHTDRAGPAVFSPDGRLIASGGDDKRIILWDVATRAAFELPYEGRDEVRTITFSPDGTLLATSGHHVDRTVTIWDVGGRRPRQTLAAHADDVRSVAFHPGGAVLASAGVEGVVLLWDLPSGRVTTRLDHGGPINAIAFSPDGSLLATGGEDGRVRLWDVAAAEQTALLQEHSEMARVVAFSPDGRTLATAGNYSGDERGVLLFDVATGELLGNLVGHQARVFSLAFSADDRTLASAGRDGQVLLWDYRRGQLSEPPLEGHVNSVRSVAFAPDGDTMVTAGDDSLVLLWRRSAGSRLATELGSQPDPVTAVVSDGRDLLVTGGADGLVTVWAGVAGERRRELVHPESVTSVALAAGRPVVAAGGLDGTVMVWDADTGAVRGRLSWPAAGQAVLAVALSPDGRLVAAGGEDGTLRRWDVEAGRELPPLPTSSDHLVAVAWSPDGGRVAAGGRDGRLWAWDGPAGSQPRRRLVNCPRAEELILCGRAMRAVAFSPDGSRLAAASADSSVTLWDPGREQALRPVTAMHGHFLGVRGVAFSPDGSLLASVGEDARLVLWDLRTGLRVGDPLEGHDGPLGGAAFMMGADMVVTGGDDGRVVSWDLREETGRALACGIANRELTVDERQQYLGSGRARATCG